MQSSRFSAVWQIIGLLVAFGGTFTFLAARISTHDLASVHDDILTIVFEWIVFAILSFIAFVILRRRWADYYIRMFGWRDVTVMLAALVCTFVFTGIAVSLLRSFSVPSLHLSSVPLSLRVLLVLTAGICEEFMYRGFGIEELARFTHNRWTAGALSLLFFTFGHVGRYGFSIALLVPAIAGGFLTLLYLLRRNLPICMLMHAIIDGIFIVIIPQFVR